MDVVRNGIKAPNLRLPFTVALFIAKAAIQILKPGALLDSRGGETDKAEVLGVSPTGFFTVERPLPLGL